MTTTSKITEIPPDWSSEKDWEYCHESCGGGGDLHGIALQGVAAFYDELEREVDNALWYFERRDRELVEVKADTLELSEKLSILLRIVSMRNDSEPFKSECLARLRECQFVDQERKRVVHAYYSGENQWLKPLCDVATQLFEAGGQLCGVLEDHQDSLPF